MTSNNGQNLDTMRDKLKDPNYKADDYEVKLVLGKKGLVVERRCTDVFCLIVFLSLITFMTFMTCYGHKYGNPAKLMAPVVIGD